MKFNVKANAGYLASLKGRQALEAAAAGISAVTACCALYRIISKRRQLDRVCDNVCNEVDNIAELCGKLDELEKFRLTMASINAARRAAYLKRELTEEEIDLIERRIYFNKESMQDILAEMDLLK